MQVVPMNARLCLCVFLCEYSLVLLNLWCFCWILAGARLCVCVAGFACVCVFVRVGVCESFCRCFFGSVSQPVCFGVRGSGLVSVWMWVCARV